MHANANTETPVGPQLMAFEIGYRGQDNTQSRGL
jgi:hypothetical protein